MTQFTGGTTNYSYADPFDDDADVRDEHFQVNTFNATPRDGTMTFPTTADVVHTPAPSLPSASRTEAQSIISNYRRTSSPALPDTTSRRPTPSLSERNAPFDDLTVPYKDEDTYSTLRPSSFVGKSDAALMHNAADMGRSNSYQDLGMSCDHVATTVA